MEQPQLCFGTSDSQVEYVVLDNEAVVISCPALPGVRQASLAVGAEDLGPPSARLGEEVWRWEWQPRGRAGAFRAVLGVVADVPHSWQYTFHVKPAKLEQDHYEAMLAAIQRLATALVYAIGGGTSGVRVERGPTCSSSMVEEYWTRLVAQVELATRITRALSRGSAGTLQSQETESPLSETRDVSGLALSHAMQRPLDEVDGDVNWPALVPLAFSGGRRLPRSLPQRSVAHTRDTYEHRLLLKLLEMLRWRCLFVCEALHHEISWRQGSQLGGDGPLLHSLAHWRSQAVASLRILQHWLQAEMFTGVSRSVAWTGPTERMRRDSRYRRVGELWHMVHGHPFVAVHSPAFELPIDNIPALYEQWCLMEVMVAAASLGDLVEQNVLEERSPQHAAQPGTFRLRLPEDRLLMRWRCANGAELKLFYRRRFRPLEGHGPELGSLDPFLRVPDIVLEVAAQDRPPSVLIFDAKYRATPSGTLPEEVLSDAYTYSSAIGRRGVPATCGVFLLFPGNAGFQAGNVGALALRPGENNDLRAVIAQRVTDGRR